MQRIIETVKTVFSFIAAILVCEAMIAGVAALVSIIPAAKTIITAQYLGIDPRVLTFGACEIVGNILLIAEFLKD